MARFAKFLAGLALAGAVAGAACPAFAGNAPGIEISSDVFVERVEIAPDGSRVISLEQPTRVLPGENLIFVLAWRNSGNEAARDFVVTNPLPGAVRFDGTADGREQVSIDGGASWGRLADLFVTLPNGEQRPALRDDVTHVRWVISDEISKGSEGKLKFRGVVR